MKNKKVRYVKNHKERNKNSNTSEPDMSSLFKIVIGVSFAFLILTGISVLLTKSDFFAEGYKAPELKAAEISYENILIGMTFNRKDKEYYVAFDEFSNDNINYYFEYIISGSKSDKPIYKVDMALGFNNPFLKDKTNTKAQTVKDLSINGVTLIKVKNGKNILYLTDLEKIVKELAKK